VAPPENQAANRENKHYPKAWGVPSLLKKLQMQAFEQDRNTTEKRAPLWIFQKLDTVRRNFIQRAGRITRPKGKLTLSIDANEDIQRELLHFLDVLEQPAGVA
jgi:hypothetical protein